MHPLTLSRTQSREVDRVAIRDFGIPGMVLMENAGRGCVDLLERRGIRGSVALFCGGGNNGGDALVMARHLAGRGYQPKIVMVPDPETLTGDALTNYQVLHKSQFPMVLLHEEGGPAAVPDALDFYLDDSVDWIVDALLGTGATGPPRPPYDTVIEWMNAESRRRLAIDLPSGLDCDTGEASSTTFRANVTATFVARKPGFDTPEAVEYLGDVEVIDIGITRAVLDQVTRV